MLRFQTIYEKMFLDMSDSIQELTKEIRDFIDAREWIQDDKLELKGLAISISIEAAELLDHFQWVRDKNISEHVEKDKEKISEELADVAIYALQFADRMGIDLGDAIQKKMRKNEQRYPLEKSKSNRVKYTEL